MAKIPIILEPGRADGKLTTSNAIFDENKGMFQSEINDIQDTLNSDNPNKPLSANQGKVLKEIIDTKVIEVGGVPMDTEPTEGNVNHVVTSDGIRKVLLKKVNTDIFEEKNKKQDEKLSELEKDNSENRLRSKWIQLLEDKGFFLTDENRNICFSVIEGIIDGLELGDNLKGQIIDIIKKNVDFSDIEESIRNINIALKELSEEITDIPLMTVDNDGLYITDKNGNITWFIKTFVVEQEGTYAIDENGNIGIQIVNGEIQTSNIKNDIDEKAFVMAKDNSEEIAKLSAKTEASVKSLIKVVNPNVEQKEISITIPPSTTGKDVYDAMVRIGIHYGSKGDEVLDAINGYPAIYDEVYFDGKCEKDFSDIRIFDTNGKMLPIITQSHGNYEVVPDNRLRRGQNRMMPNAVGMLLKLNEGDNKVYVSVNDGTSWDKISDKSYRSFVGVDNRNNAYLIAGTSSDFPSTGNGNVVKIPFIDGAYDYSKSKVVCDLGYDNYDYHTTITINGTAINNGVLRLQCSPSNDFVNWYDIEITKGMTANDICSKISQISFKNNENGWIATYNGGNSVELNSNKTLIYIEPELKGNISGISYSINTTKDNATRNTEASNNSFVSYSHNGVDYVFLGQYQENTNANIRRSTDGGETFHTVLDNQKKYEVTGRNAQHIHHIDYDAYHHVLYAGIDHAAIPYGPTVIRSFDNGATWEDVTFTEEEARTNKNARIWLNDRSRDYTPCWFSMDGSFSLGGGETSELGGCTILRIDNSDGVLDRKFVCVVDTLQRAMCINSFDDNFIIAALPSGKTNTTNQLIVSTDKGYSWKSIYSHLDPTSTNHVGNGLRYQFHHYPNGGEHHIISTGVVERGSFPSVRIFKGGNHYYAEIYVKVGFLPKEGTTLTVKSGYLMEYPQICIKDRDLIKPYFNISLSEGYGNIISDAKGNVYPIVGKHTWESANLSIATTLPVDYPYKKMFGLRLAEGSHVNLGKMNLSKNGGWSVSFWVNFKNIGLAEQNPHYLERSVILKWGNTAIYFTLNGICVGDNTNALYRYNYKGLSNDLYVLYCVAFSTENESGTNMPKMSAWCNDLKFNRQLVRGTASKIVMSDPKINDMTIGCVEPRRDYYFCNNDDIYIADIRIYDKELTDEDVYKIHNGFGVRYEQNV